MTVATVKERLHGYIDHADEKKLQAIYTLVENEISIYDDATLNMLHETSADYHSGKMKGYSIEESMENIRKQIKKDV